uniref:Major facilitator superfamily (MFS) profile domain-containing protein n=1 Tax=Octactis speculum TaxID=3111310 RepID=A0A7S2AVG5_9STRA|mmetsp:Transcript_15606/g.20990  ORF Transcript_15606/g.20990 Transcript_15606/m.20990 type:complete len:238 (+) Transcript_15606:65-778(+)
MRPKLHKAAKPLSRFGRIVTLGGLFPWPRVFLDPWLRITGCWSMYCMNFRNNFIGFSMIYVLPLITARDYGYGQLENSYCFTVIAVTRMSAGALIATHLAKRYQDRTLIVLLTTIGALSILVYMSVSSCSQGALPVVVFVALFSAIQASDPAAPTQGLYSKLIGRGNAGLYFAVLQGNGAIARTLSGQLVGFAYGTLGRLETQDEDDAQVERKAPQTLLPDQSPLLQQLLVKESDLC